MDKSPIVSVVIPSLNRGRYLAETIDSILGQNYPNIECIIVDGGSQDNTFKTLKKYNGRIKLIHGPDKGPADAINKGWKASNGEIVAWLNADDYYAVPDSIAQAVRYFQNNGDIDVVYGNYSIVSEEGQAISGVLRPRKWDLEYAVKYCFYTITQPASFIRRTILEKVNWLDDNLINNHDFDLWLRVGLAGSIKYVPEFFAYKRECAGKTDERSMGPATVQVMEKFLSSGNLPRDFVPEKFKRRAMSNAYLVGSNFALLGPYIREFIVYLFKSAKTDPSNWPRIIIKTARTMLSVSIPKKSKIAVKKLSLKWA